MENNVEVNTTNKFNGIKKFKIIIILISVVLPFILIIIPVYYVLNFFDNITDNFFNNFYGCTNCNTIVPGSALYDRSYTKSEFVRMVETFSPPKVTASSGKNTEWGYETFFKSNAEVFFDIATSYGLDPRFIFCIGIHESYYGTSQIAMDKGNFFGYGAFDSSPYDSALTFYDMSDGITTVSQGLKNYMTPGTWYYNKILANGYMPNTIDGMGSIYASDPDWAMKVKRIMSNIFGYNENAYSNGIGTVTISEGDGYTSIYTSSFGKSYKEFKQNVTDASYANYKYGNGTISSQGCSVTSLAIVLSGYGFDVNPGIWSGGLISVSGEINSYVGGKLYSLSTSGSTSESIKNIQNHLRTGNPVIIHVLAKSSFTNNQHWMALLDISEDGSLVYLSNPNVYGQNGWVSINTALYDLKTYILVGGGNQ